MRFKIDWASLIVGKKFTVSALFYFVFEGNFPGTSPRGNIWRGDLTEGSLRYRFGGFYLEGLIFGILRYLLAASFHLLLSCTPIIIKLGFSGILHSTMVELLFKTFKCGRVDLLSRQKETFFRKQKRMCDTYY